MYSVTHMRILATESFSSISTPTQPDKPRQCVLTGSSSAPLLSLRAKHWPPCWCPLLFVRSVVGLPPFPTQTLFIAFLFIIFICYQTVVSTTDPKHSLIFFCALLISLSLLIFCQLLSFSRHTLDTSPSIPTCSPFHPIMSCHYTTPYLLHKPCNAQTLVQSLKKVIQRQKRCSYSFLLMFFSKSYS